MSDPAWDDWWHLSTEGVVARDGRLVATMAQEQLIPSP
jgi:hypothetical protein